MPNETAPVPELEPQQRGIPVDGVPGAAIESLMPHQDELVDVAPTAEQVAAVLGHEPAFPNNGGDVHVDPEPTPAPVAEAPTHDTVPSTASVPTEVTDQAAAVAQSAPVSRPSSDVQVSQHLPPARRGLWARITGRGKHVDAFKNPQ